MFSPNRELEKQTKNTLQNLANLGAMLLMETGSADQLFESCEQLADVNNENVEETIEHRVDREAHVLALHQNRVHGAQNVEWALLNLVEFLYNF